MARNDGSDLDGAALRAAHRIRNGLPPFFLPGTMYGHAVRDGRLVVVPIGARSHRPVSFKGLSV